MIDYLLRMEGDNPIIDIIFYKRKEKDNCNRVKWQADVWRGNCRSADSGKNPTLSYIKNTYILDQH